MTFNEETKAEIGRLRLQGKDILVVKTSRPVTFHSGEFREMLKVLGLKDIGVITLNPEDEIGILRLESPLDAFDDPEAD